MFTYLQQWQHGSIKVSGRDDAWARVGSNGLNCVTVVTVPHLTTFEVRIWVDNYTIVPVNVSFALLSSLNTMLQIAQKNAKLISTFASQLASVEFNSSHVCLCDMARLLQLPSHFVLKCVLLSFSEVRLFVHFYLEFRM